MDLTIQYFYEIFFVIFTVFLVFAIVRIMKRNNTVYQKYDESLEMSKIMMERQKQVVSTLEETNKLLAKILAAVKK